MVVFFSFFSPLIDGETRNKMRRQQHLLPNLSNIRGLFFPSLPCCGFSFVLRSVAGILVTMVRTLGRPTAWDI